MKGWIKDVAQGGMQEGVHLPLYLTGWPLSPSISTLHQAFTADLVARWKTQWRSSPLFGKLSRIDRSLPLCGFHKLMEGLSRAQTSILIQSRSGHIALIGYLHRITESDSPTCLSCKQDVKSVHHYLFDCPTWKHKRWHLGQVLGQDSKSETCVLNSAKGIKVGSREGPSNIRVLNGEL